eukprot:5688252-Amphidinium_carterae.1
MGLEWVQSWLHRTHYRATVKARNTAKEGAKACETLRLRNYSISPGLGVHFEELVGSSYNLQ